MREIGSRRRFLLNTRDRVNKTNTINIGLTPIREFSPSDDAAVNIIKQHLGN